MPVQHDLGIELAKYSIRTQYEALPSDAVDAAKKSVIDLLGVILAASGVEPVSQLILGFVEDSGGKPQATAFGLSQRVSAPWAAFANGALAHCLDFDDLTPWGAHATSSILPAVLALAERKGEVSGLELITAVAVGQDLFARMRRNVDWRKDWNISTVLGVFAATAAAGRVAGLNEVQMCHALSLAAMQASGTMDTVYGLGGDQRCIYAGFSAKSAVLSVLLAQRGIAGTSSAFSGEYGFFNTFFADAHNTQGILDGLGQRFTGGSTLYKPWPAVGPAHGHIHATIQLVVEHDLRPADIAEINVSIGDYHEIMCSPLEARRAPGNLVDAKFSLPFLVAVAAARRKIELTDFLNNGLQDPVVLELSRKVTPLKDSAFDWKMELPSGRVEIVTVDGRRLALTGVNVPGSPAAPLSWAGIEQKFSDCAALAKTPISPQTLRRVLEQVHDLEQVENAVEIVHALRG